MGKSKLSKIAIKNTYCILMKQLLYLTLFISLASCNINNKNTDLTLDLIPKPTNAVIHKGNFIINENTVIIASGKAIVEADNFTDIIAPSLGYKLEFKKSETFQNTITFKLSDTLTSLGDEGYKLSISTDKITIEAQKPTGLFYATQTLRQLLPSEIYATEKQVNINWSLPCVSITDSPRFKWRGYMLDVSRNFFDTQYIKRLLDRMAVHKMNIFHWHLTDDEGWRIEIKSYPKLTELGAWRGKNEALKPSRGSGDSRYGGYYTQEQIKEIVAYAAKRHIHIVPEIDIPGHAKAMVVAYPELLPDGVSNTKSVQGISNNVISPVKPETYEILDNIFKEIATLFPFEYIHIGGDEVNTSAWLQSTSCQKFMKENNLKTGYQLQNYFIKRMETMISEHGKKMIGWNEILHGGSLNKETAVMSWTGTEPGYESAKNGHKVIMTPGPYTYFDMKSSKEDEFGHWWAGIVSMEQVYSYDPLAKNELQKTALDNILGVQACLWSEFLFKKGRAEYQTWPRLCALAEVAWTTQKNRNFTNFSNRMGKTHFDRLDALNIAYRVPQPSAFLKNNLVTIKRPWEGANIRYTTDASIPTGTSTLYTGHPFHIEDHLKLRMKLFTKNRESRTVKNIEIRNEIIAKWTPKDCDTIYKSIEFNIQNIDSTGFWHFDFLYKKGAHRIDIKSVALLKNGKIISNDTHLGHAGSQHINNRYRLHLKSHHNENKYSLRVTMKSDGGTDSFGNITLKRASYLEPQLKVESLIKSSPNHKTPFLTDWNRNTFFKSASKVNKDAVFTFVFQEKIAVRKLEILSGHPIKNENILVDASVYIETEDNKNEKINDFEYGTSKNVFETTKLIKSITIKINSPHENAIILQDLKIK